MKNRPELKQPRIDIPVDSQRDERPWLPLANPPQLQSSIAFASPPKVSRDDAFQNALALQQQGRLDEAQRSYESILKLQPHHFGALYHLGLIHAQQKRHAEAEKLLGRAIREQPDSAQAHYHMASVLSALNLIDKAVEYYRQAITLHPNSFDAHTDLAVILQKLGRHREALPHYERAVVLLPNSAEVHCNLASGLVAVDRMTEALAQYQRALVLKPNFILAQSNLGKLLLLLGRVDESRSVLEQAVAAHPQDTSLFLCLTEAKRFQKNDPHLKMMDSIEANVASLSQNEQIDLHFALGKALADTDDSSRSFHHLLLGNEFKRQSFAYDEALVLQLFQGIQEAYAPGCLQADHPCTYPSEAPIFIVGMPRSGTTLVEQILASHPEVFGAGEIGDFQKCGEEILGLDRPISDRRTMTPVALYRLGEHYLNHVRSRASGAQRITDKTNSNFTSNGLIHPPLPNAQIIHVSRDPVDTCFSCFSKLFADGQFFTYDLGELGRYYRAYADLMAHWRTVLPEGRMLEVRYEDFVQDFDNQARRLLDHCGLEWDDSCREFYKSKRPVKTASAVQVRQPLYNSSIGSSRPYRQYLGPLLDALGDLAGD